MDCGALLRQNSFHRAHRQQVSTGACTLHGRGRFLTQNVPSVEQDSAFPACSLPAARPSYGGGKAGCPGLQPNLTHASCCLRSGFSFSLRGFMGNPPPSSLWGLVPLPPPSAGRSCAHCPGAGVLLPARGGQSGVRSSTPGASRTHTPLAPLPAPSTHSPGCLLHPAPS